MTPLEQHHPDCDGFRFAHVGTVVNVGPPDHPLWQPVCERCPWEGPRFGRSSRTDALRMASDHTELARCDGACADWD